MNLLNDIFKLFKTIFLELYRLLPILNKRHRDYKAQAKRILRKMHTHPQKDNAAYMMGILRNCNPYVFEELLLLCFKACGFRTKGNLRYSGDGGIDGTFYDANNRMIIIQAKRYSSAINPQHVKNFEQTILHSDAYRGVFIHTGRTGKTAHINKTDKMEILSGSKLIEFIMKGIY